MGKLVTSPTLPLDELAGAGVTGVVGAGTLPGKPGMEGPAGLAVAEPASPLAGLFDPFCVVLACPAGFGSTWNICGGVDGLAPYLWLMDGALRDWDICAPTHEVPANQTKNATCWVFMVTV